MANRKLTNLTKRSALALALSQLFISPTPTYSAQTQLESSYQNDQISENELWDEFLNFPSPIEQRSLVNYQERFNQPSFLYDRPFTYNQNPHPNYQIDGQIPIPNYYSKDKKQDSRVSKELFEIIEKDQTEDENFADLRIDPNLINKSERYAVIIYGENDVNKNSPNYFFNNSKAIYNDLLQSGFPKENIFVLDEFGEDKENYNSVGIANRENIDLLFNYLSKKVDDNDLLVVHVGGHGLLTEKFLFTNKTISETQISLPSGNIPDWEFKNYLRNVNPKFGIVTTDICHGEGIISGLGDKYVGISQTTFDNFAFISENTTFGTEFYDAFEKDKTLADFNSDGYVSIQEAFDYAKITYNCTRYSCKKDDVKIKPIPQLKTTLDPNSLTLSTEPIPEEARNKKPIIKIYHYF